MVEALELDETRTRTAGPPGPREVAPRWVVPVVAGLFVVALAVRALVGLHSGLWRDEAQLLFIVDEPSWSAMLGFLRQHESHPPLMYAIMRVWLAVAGHSDAAALAVPIALGGALVPALYAVGARLLSWRAGLFAAAAAALSPVVIEVGATVRPYSLLPLLALGATYALVRAVDLGGGRRWAAYAVTTLALVYTHNWGWLVLAAQWVALAVCLWRGVPRPRWAVLRGWAGAQAAVAIGFLPWLPSLLHQGAHAGYPSSGLSVDGPGRVLAILVGVTTLVVTSTLTLHDAAALPAAGVLWTLTVGVLAVAARRRPADLAQPRRAPSTARTVIVVTPFAAVGAALLLSAHTDLLVPHCLVVLAPLLLLVVAGALDRWRAAGLAWLAGTAVVSLIASYAVMLPALEQRRSNAREVADLVAAQTAPTDTVVIGQWWLASSFNRYYLLPTEQIDFPAFARVGAVPYDDVAHRIADPVAFAEADRRLAAGRAAGRRVWLVTEGEQVPCPDAACEARELGSSDFGSVAALRTAELRVLLTRLYGPPVSCRMGPDGGGRHESLTACLYAPS